MIKYWIWLATRKGLGPGGARLVAQHFASPELAYFAQPGEYESIEGLRSWESLLDKDMTLPEQIVQQCYTLGISVLTMQDAAYPERLRMVDDAPLVLYYRGILPDLNGPAIAVVGTRKASAYGMTQARRLGYSLARCGCTVISGAARGIDTEATKGALTGGGPVVAVLGGGVDVVYPKENKYLLQDVEHTGCLLSEYPPGTQPLSGHFPVRNRIISALSLGVLVAEAPEKSGALITAARALEQGRDVFVLPANVDVESCGGNLKLLRDGAIPVRDAWDILQEYVARYPDRLVNRAIPEVKRPKQEQQAEPRQEIPVKKDIDKPKRKVYIDLKERMEDLSQDEQSLVTLLKNGPMHIDDLADLSHLGAGRALASLTLLEVKGMVQRPSPRMYELAEE